MEAVASLGDTPNLTAEASAVIRQTHAYLATRQEHMRYATFTAAGYPIGSGCVESAHKLVVEARLKGAGMHGHASMSIRSWRCAACWSTGAGSRSGRRSGGNCARGGARCVLVTGLRSRPRLRSQCRVRP